MQPSSETACKNAESNAKTICAKTLHHDMLTQGNAINRRSGCGFEHTEHHVERIAGLS